MILTKWSGEEYRIEGISTGYGLYSPGLETRKGGQKLSLLHIFPDGPGATPQPSL